MTKQEYKQLKEALDKLTEHIVDSLDKYHENIKSIINKTNE